MVDVSTEALKTVKDALSAFQTDINGISLRATNQADGVTSECKIQISRTKGEITQLEREIEELSKQIEQLEARVNQATNEYNSLIKRIPQVD